MIRAIIFDCFGVFYFDTLPPAEQFNQPLADLLPGLRSHYRIGMLSNTKQAFLETFLTAHGVRDLFDEVLASSESQHEKPHRQIFEEIATRLDVNLDEMLFIDDSPGYVSAAISYGIRSILYKNPTQLEQELREAEIHLT